MPSQAAFLKSAQLSQIASELYQVLQKDERGEIGSKVSEFILSFTTEPKIDDLSLLSYTGIEKSQNIEALSNSTPKTFPKSNQNIPINFSCTLCSNRLYPVRNFFHSEYKASQNKKIPILILHYNAMIASTNSSNLKRDLSEKYIFGGEKEDKLFSRMLTKLKCETDDFYYQEYPACHFDCNRSSDDDWITRTKNCMEHVSNTIKKFDIRKIIICGEAAIALFGERGAQEKFQNHSIFKYSIGTAEIECIVLRSPAALLSLEKKRKEISDIENQKDILEKEKRIKESMLVSLKTFLKPFITSL